MTNTFTVVLTEQDALILRDKVAEEFENARTTIDDDVAHLTSEELESFVQVRDASAHIYQQLMYQGLQMLKAPHLRALNEQRW